MTQFEHVIKAYLDERAANDPLFAKSYANEKKSVEECCKYIMGEACHNAISVDGGKADGMTNEEVFGLAVHYYDEADIKIRPISGRCDVAMTGVNVNYEPTAEEIEEARKAALKRLEEEAYQKLHTPKKAKPVVEQPVTAVQTSLFD